jgi:hypothetical protein
MFEFEKINEKLEHTTDLEILRLFPVEFVNHSSEVPKETETIVS